MTLKIGDTAPLRGWTTALQLSKAGLSNISRHHAPLKENWLRSKHENVNVVFHFTADEGKAMDRVNDYKTICKSLSLSPEKQGDTNNG